MKNWGGFGGNVSLKVKSEGKFCSWVLSVTIFTSCPRCSKNIFPFFPSLTPKDNNAKRKKDETMKFFYAFKFVFLEIVTKETCVTQYVTKIS